MIEDIFTTSQNYSETMIDGNLNYETINDPLSVVNNLIDDGLIEAIWQGLNGRISYEQIRQTAHEVAAKYVDASIITFLTIFIRRETIERLK